MDHRLAVETELAALLAFGDQFLASASRLLRTPSKAATPAARAASTIPLQRIDQGRPAPLPVAGRGWRRGR